MSRPSRGKTTPAMLMQARAQRQHMTRAETILWNHLRTHRLEGLKFRRLHPFGRFILDFYNVAHHVAIEVDGGVHQQPEQAAYDAARSAALQELGVCVIRFTNDEVENNLEVVLQQIAKACQSAV